MFLVDTVGSKVLSEVFILSYNVINSCTVVHACPYTFLMVACTGRRTVTVST